MPGTSFYSNSSVVRRLFAESDSENDDPLPPPPQNGGEEMEIEVETTIDSARRRLYFDEEDSDSDSESVSDSDSDQGITLTSSQEGRLVLFNDKLFREWNRSGGCDSVDIPVLIMDVEGMRRNKDVDALPRFYMNQLRGSYSSDPHIPFVYMEDAGAGSDGGRFVGLRECFHNLLGKKPKGCIPAAKFRDILEKKPAFDSMMAFYEGVNIFLYSTFLLKQFAPIFGYIPQFYSPISDEAKYYFYIFFDYLRRKAIASGTFLRKRTVVALVRDLGALDGLALSADLVVKRVHGIDYDLFHRDGFTLLDSSEPFAFAI